MLYFSYGSNMSVNRLIDRISAATKLGVGLLREHELRFHKLSNKDNSAKCDVYATGKQDHFVYGVVYDIATSARSVLDQFEGLGNGYEVKDIMVEVGEEWVNAFTYYATHIDVTLKPLHWYKEHVLRGAREHQLPTDYIQKIESIESIPDLDTDRHMMEMAIY